MHTCVLFFHSLCFSRISKDRDRHWNEDHQPETAYNDGTFGRNIAIEPWQRIVVSSTIDVEIPQKEKSICDWLLCVSICLGRKKRKGNFFADERCVLCLLCIRTDGRTDGMSTDYSSLSLRSAAKCAEEITFFFFFFFSRKNKTKQKTNWLYTQGAAGNTRRVRQSQVHTHHDDFVRSECTLNKTAAPTFTRIGWLVCPLCIYRYIYLYMYVCIEGRERERGRNISALHAKLKKRNRRRRRDRMGAGYWWGGERTSRCGARCCLDVATKHKPANHHHLFPSTKRESFSLFFFVSVCVSSLFFKKKKFI